MLLYRTTFLPDYFVFKNCLQSMLKEKNNKYSPIYLPTEELIFFLKNNFLTDSIPFVLVTVNRRIPETHLLIKVLSIIMC